MVFKDVISSSRVQLGESHYVGDWQNKNKIVTKKDNTKTVNTQKERAKNIEDFQWTDLIVGCAWAIEDPSPTGFIYFE